MRETHSKATSIRILYCLIPRVCVGVCVLKMLHISVPSNHVGEANIWSGREGGEEDGFRRTRGAHKFIADKMHYCTHQIDM